MSERRRSKRLLPTIWFPFPLGKGLLQTIRFPFPLGKGLGVRFLAQFAMPIEGRGTIEESVLRYD
jgi:hypothetical protein